MEDQKFYYCFTKLHGSGWSDDGDVSGKRPAMDLFECIEKHEPFSEPIARYIFRQIADAVGFLHHNGLVHRDIKDENILIDDKYKIKLIDFGSSAMVDPQGKPFTLFLGTRQYAAPEILGKRAYYGKPADIWALGCCLYIILTGVVPFASDEQAQKCHFTKPSANISMSCLDLLFRMLDKNPLTRATISEVREHPWMQADLRL
jgi:serine/threonine protein kinase